DTRIREARPGARRVVSLPGCGRAQPTPEVVRLGDEVLLGDDDVARLELEGRAAALALNEPADVETDASGPRLPAEDEDAIPVRILLQATGLSQRTQHPHVAFIRVLAGPAHLTQDQDRGRRSLFYRDGDHRCVDVLLELLLDERAEGGRGLARRWDVVQEREGDLAVGRYVDLRRHLVLSEHAHVQEVARTDHSGVSLGGGRLVLVDPDEAADGGGRARRAHDGEHEDLESPTSGRAAHADR